MKVAKIEIRDMAENYEVSPFMPGEEDALFTTRCEEVYIGGVEVEVDKFVTLDASRGVEFNIESRYDGHSLHVYPDEKDSGESVQ